MRANSCTFTALKMSCVALGQWVSVSEPSGQRWLFCLPGIQKCALKR